MKDLTLGSVPRHLVAMALPMFAGMILQTLYFVVDLYFVAKLGSAAVAGVSAAGNANFLVFALTQMLGAGVVALISQAVGRKDAAQANLAFNQALGMSFAIAALVLLLGWWLATAYVASVLADPASQRAGRSFLLALLPGLALQFPMVAMGSALRATGVVKPTMLVSMLTLLLNVVLAPVLIAGWGTGRPLGVLGAGLATSISVAVGLVLLSWYFHSLEKYVAIERRSIRPQWSIWRRVLLIGLPAGGEFALLFVYFTVIYVCLSGVGAAAQAGFGIGSRVMQSIFLPALAVAFAAAPIVGQNYGAQLAPRVRATVRSAAYMSVTIMSVLMLLCLWQPEQLVSFFTADGAVMEFASEFLQIVALSFAATALIFICSSVFQGLGNNWPPLLASGTRLATFVIPALWMRTQPWFLTKHLWWLSVATVALQALISILLLRRELKLKLDYQPIAQ